MTTINTTMSRRALLLGGAALGGLRRLRQPGIPG